MNIEIVRQWFDTLGWKPQVFQQQAWEAFMQGKQGMVNAPTGSGKTYSLMLPALLHASSLDQLGVKVIWITPLRALAKEIHLATERAIAGMQLSVSCALRTGDTPVSEKKKQKDQPPDVLITTPESLHLLFSHKGYAHYFQALQTVVVDEWHELLGSKRGVQVELALSRLKSLRSELRIWGISATIGNMDEAMQVLLGSDYKQGIWIKHTERKPIEIHTILPDEIEKFPWGGHLGIALLPKILPLIQSSKSTLIFTNTRSQAEIWYHRLLEAEPDLAGQMAMHHGSISEELRSWVEDRLHEGKLKAVVCTSSLDLGVDFRPVETVIQIGSPKGVARCMQRAGRSGHAPGMTSRLYFVPTHSLELLEGAALREAIEKQHIEHRIPYLRSFDVLVQYLVTLAVSDGFKPEEVLREIRTTACFQSITEEEFADVLQFITLGGPLLKEYKEFHKVVIDDGLYKVVNKKIAMRHRLSIGTIVSDMMLRVKYMSGKHIGQIEEWFISKLKPGDVFYLAGSALEILHIKDSEVVVRKSKSNEGIIPSWQGGRMPLSSQLTESLRQVFHHAMQPEVKALMPLFQIQQQRSLIPDENTLLIEKIKTREGHHLFFYPFEGRLVHEGLAALFAYRISKIKPITFSMAMNDYGFELLSDQEIPIKQAIENGLFSTANLIHDIRAGVNDTELARRRFRDIARITGLVFSGYPGAYKKEKHLQAGSSLFFDVFSQYEPNHFLLRQAYEEVYEFQMEYQRLFQALQRMENLSLKITTSEKPTPFCFPILAERIREKFSNEPIEERIRKMQLAAV